MLLDEKGILGCAHYDLLLMFCASVGEMKLYSTGSDKSRIEKTYALLVTSLLKNT